jgi:hypothetical protein
VAGCEVVRAVEHHVGFAHNLRKVFGSEALLHGDYRDFRIHVRERKTRGVDLRFADGIGAVKDLALQVGEVDRVAVDEGQPADAGGGEVERGGAAEAARADDQRRGGAQLLLPLDTELGEEDVPAVAEKLLVVNFVRGEAARPSC